MIQPDVNASLGFQQMTVNISSAQYPGVYTLLPVQFLVKADRIPVINHPPYGHPARPATRARLTLNFPTKAVQPMCSIS